MKTTQTSLCIALMTAICGHAVGGEITPPAGPIAPTMKSLDRIEPRVCINDLPGDQGAMHVITKPGRYYLAGDITIDPGKSGIVCALDDDSDNDGISIDMDGYSCIGTPGSLHGIFVPDVQNVRVERFNVKQEFGQQSGTRRCGGDGVHTAGADVVNIGISSEDNMGAGVRAKNVVRFKAGSELSGKVNIANNGGGGGTPDEAVGGIIIEGCPDTTIVGVDAIRNFGTGVSLNYTVPEQWVKKVSVENVRCSDNTGHGMSIDHGVGGDVSVRIRSVSMDANMGAGLRIMGHGNESQEMSISMDELHLSSNGLHGADISSFEACTMTVRVTDASFTRNILAGLHIFGEEGGRVARLRAERCVASENGGNGVETIADDETYLRCEASDNTQDGFHNLASPALLRPIVNKSILKAYFNTSANRNGGDGIHGEECVLTVNVCHLISNGDNGLEVTSGAADIRSSGFESNFGSGVRAIDSDIRSHSTIMSDNELYGLHFTSGPGETHVMALDSGKIMRNREGGCLTENGSMVCGDSNHFISNGGGGGGTGSGFDAIDAGTVMLTNSSSTGNAGDGVSIRSSGAQGSPPTQLKLDGVLTSHNGVHGVYSEKASFGGMRGCDAYANGGDGFHASSDVTGLRVEACASSGNAGAGFNFMGFGNVLVNNAAISNTQGAVLAPVPGNIVGPQIDEGGVQQNGNPAAIYNR